MRQEQCMEFACSLVKLLKTNFLSFFLIFLLSLLSTGKRFPCTSLAPNIQNYVTGTMKSQHVFLMSSDFTQVAKAKYKPFLPFFFSICFAKKKKKEKNEKRKRISVAFLREKFQPFLYFSNTFLLMCKKWDENVFVLIISWQKIRI